MKTPLIKNPRTVTALNDWGSIGGSLQGVSKTSGVLLHKGAQGESECGIWCCTPGKWRCEVTRDEFCHFIEGRCTYIHQSGEVIEIRGDCIAFFPAGWKGVCQVFETVRKVYMIR